MTNIRRRLAGWFRRLDRSLWLGWDIYSNATEETRYIAFPRVSLYCTDIVASWLEGETCWLVRGREMEALEREEHARRAVEAPAAPATAA